MKEQWGKFGLVLVVLGLTIIIYSLFLGFSAWVAPVFQDMTLGQARWIEIKSAVTGCIGVAFFISGIKLLED